MSAEPIPNGEVVVEAGQIVEVRPQPSGTPAPDALDLGDAIVMPGLFNGHCHLEYTALRGYDDHVPFFEWVRALVALKARLPETLWLPSAMLGAAELIASGVTFVADNTDTGVSAEVLARAGLRGRVYQEVFGIEPEPDDATLLRGLNEKLDTLQNTLRTLEATERVSVGVSPHAVYTVRDSLLKAVVKMAHERALPLSMHASESSEEVALTRSGSGSFAEMFVERKIRYLHPRVPPVEYLHQAGVLSPAMQLVHCVRVEPREIEYIARSGAMVAHCPRSNARLLTGIAPIHAMRRLGIPIVVGTDSAVSAGTLDLWEEVRTAALLQRASSYSATPHWRDWIAMLTLEAAKAFGVADTTGSLEVGKSADLIAVRTQRIAYTGMPDPYSALVLVTRSDDVALTMVQGELLYQDGTWRTLNPQQTRESVLSILEAQGQP